MNTAFIVRQLTLSISLIILSFVGIYAQAPSSQTDLGIALQRGYRTGYSDGYMSGYRDTIDSVSSDLRRHSEYYTADRAYNQEYGPLVDYRDGYQQGYEAGYDTGYSRRAFESSLPQSIARRGVQSADLGPISPVPASSDSMSQSRPADQDRSTAAGQSVTDLSYAAVMIPCDTEIIVELKDDLSTEQAKEGQKFTATVVSPSEIAGATIEGRVAKVSRPGRLKRRSELLLAFDRIILNDTRWSNFSGTLIEVMAVKGDNISRVDVEGTAIGQSSFKTDAIKVGGATGTGLIAGAIVGGPVGAAVGAGMGAAFGVGAVVIDRGKHIRLNKNQQLRIKTAHETQIR